jgi:hypothetical protein
VFLGLGAAFSYPCTIPRMPLGDDQQNSTPVRSTSIWLLCLPCWILAAYALVVVIVAKLAPAYTHVVVSKKFTFVPAILAIASPFLWLVGVGKSFRRYRRTGVRVPATWSFLLLSGIVMFATWVLLIHFSHR